MVRVRIAFIRVVSFWCIETVLQLSLRYVPHDLELTGPCTIERRAASTLNEVQFVSEYVAILGCSTKYSNSNKAVTFSSQYAMGELPIYYGGYIITCIG